MTHSLFFIATDATITAEKVGPPSGSGRDSRATAMRLQARAALNHTQSQRRGFFSSVRAGLFSLLTISLAATSCLVAQDSDATQASKQAAAEARPDIVFVISDDQAWNDYSFMGHEHIQTPNIDRLAKESRLFTRGYVPDSLCRPSLASMISGLYPHQHGIVGNDPPPADQQTRGRQGRMSDPIYQAQRERYLELHIDRMRTLPDRLQPLGYKSFQSGKWWEGNFARGGFDEGMTHGDLNRGGRHGDEGLKIGRQGLAPIAEFISKTKSEGNPYFLWYAPFLPHTPHNPPADLLAKYEKLAPSVPMAKYWAMCEWFDQTVGELREVIAEHGDADNTIIVYVCDNGWINELDESRYAPKSKRSQYDGGIRTPIMVHWPTRLSPKKDETHLASSIDLVPTVMALLSMEPDADLPGIDLSNDAALDSRKTLFGEILEHDIVSMDDPKTSLMYRWAIRDNLKLILPNPLRVADGSVELFDLATDPWEEKNLADTMPEKVAELTTEIDAWWPQ